MWGQCSELVARCEATCDAKRATECCQHYCQRCCQKRCQRDAKLVANNCGHRQLLVRHPLRIPRRQTHQEYGQAVHLLLFDDEAHSYPGPSGQWDSLSCHERIRHAKNSYRLVAGEGNFQIRVREKLRPRLWYVALADCSGSGLQSVEYEVHATNKLYGWAAEFSTDRRFALTTFVILCVILLCLAAAQVRANLS